MKKILLASMIALAAVGCQNSKKPAASTPISDLTPSASNAPVYTAPAPIPVQAVTYTQPDTAAAPASITSTPTAAGGYTVRKGDTLYGIAKKTYGDGKQWQKIASANPGLTASSLKVGQTITLP